MLDGILGKLFYASFGLSLFKVSGTRAIYDSATVAGVGNSAGQAIDFVNRKYYGSSNLGDVIYQCDFNLGNVQTFHTETDHAAVSLGLAVHPGIGKMFYQTRHSASPGPALSRIKSINLDGSGNGDLIVLSGSDGFQADGIGVSKTAGYLFYFVSKPATPTTQIRRCNLDGSGDTLLYENATFTPREIAIDNNNGYFYYSDAFSKICRMDFAGAGPTTIVDWSANSPPLPSHTDANPGNVYVIHNGLFSHKLNKLFFNLRGGQAPHDPTNLGLWSVNPDGSGLAAEIVYPNIIDKATNLPSSAALITERWRIGRGFETTGSATNAT